MEEQPITQADLEGLATKLNAVEFTDQELSILKGILDAAHANEEVKGYALNVGSLQLGVAQPQSQSEDKTYLPAARVPKFGTSSPLKAEVKPIWH